MSRGELDNATLAMISQQLPYFEELDRTVSAFSPDILSMRFQPDSTIPDSAVCLQDTVNTLAEARYALHEALAHRIWYLEKAEPKSELGAVFFSRFYIDDVALRLYSAGEHLAEAIADMLEIREGELSPYEEKRISRQTVAGHFLREKKPTHSITRAVLGLANSMEWKATMNYRNNWVHDQPFFMKGLGIVYGRHK